MIVQRMHHESPPPLSAMIIDANVASVRRLKAALRDQPRIAVRCTARTIAMAIERAERQRPDVVFLDVALADGQDIAVAQRLAPGRAVVAVSDRPDFAFSAFQFGALDYLLKPIRADRLLVTMRRIDRFFASPIATAVNDATQPSPDRLPPVVRVPIPFHRSGQRKATDLVPVTDVIWVESLQNYSIAQLPGHERRQVKRTLTEWAALLPPREFVRIGRSALIQLAKLRTIASPCRGEILVHFHGVEQPLRVGRAAAGKLRAIVRGACPA